MGTFVVSTTVFFTVVLAMAFGILLGYTVILGILRLFRSGRRASQPAAATSTVKLIAVSTH